jgi:hypothetical protein
VAEEVTYRGCCDASAAAAIDTNLVVVASDEDSRLRVYHREQGGLPVQTLELSPYLALERRSPETDIEGAARLGNRVYWITSHARNNEGQLRPNRHQFFATEFRVAGGRVGMTFAGRAYKDLLTDLISAPELTQFDFAGASRRAPKEPGGLNIEGLCATPDNQLLIGFRNPVPGGRALLVPLTNPEQVVEGQRAKLGRPILINLEGFGIRDIAYFNGHYVIVAGPFDGAGHEKLFSWAGGATKPKQFKSVKLKSLKPEGVAIYPDKGFQEFQVFRDDSSLRNGGSDCANLRDASSKRFRSVWITHETAAE